MEDQLREADKRVRALDQRCHQLEAELQTRQTGPNSADERRSLIAELEAVRCPTMSFIRLADPRGLRRWYDIVC